MTTSPAVEDTEQRARGQAGTYSSHGWSSSQPTHPEATARRAGPGFARTYAVEVALVAPDFEIERSALLRAVIDDTGVQVWDFRADAGVRGRAFADETDPALREEVEERIDEVLAGSTE